MQTADLVLECFIVVAMVVVAVAEVLFGCNEKGFLFFSLVVYIFDSHINRDMTIVVLFFALIIFFFFCFRHRLFKLVC